MGSQFGCEAKFQHGTKLKESNNSVLFVSYNGFKVSDVDVMGKFKNKNKNNNRVLRGKNEKINLITNLTFKCPF